MKVELTRKELNEVVTALALALSDSEYNRRVGRESCIHNDTDREVLYRTYGKCLFTLTKGDS